METGETGQHGRSVIRDAMAAKETGIGSVTVLSLNMVVRIVLESEER